MGSWVVGAELDHLVDVFLRDVLGFMLGQLTQTQVSMPLLVADIDPAGEDHLLIAAGDRINVEESSFAWTSFRQSHLEEIRNH